MDSRYEPNLGRNYYWMIWYPFVFWLITITATIVAFQKSCVVEVKNVRDGLALTVVFVYKIKHIAE